MAFFRDYQTPADPFYKEGPQRYSPHWARTLLGQKTPAPANTAGLQTEQPTSRQRLNPLRSSRLAWVRFDFTGTVTPFAFANGDTGDQPFAAATATVQKIDLWPRHLGHKNLFGIGFGQSNRLRSYTTVNLARNTASPQPVDLKATGRSCHNTPSPV